jgi:hypothetical protein
VPHDVHETLTGTGNAPEGWPGANEEDSEVGPFAQQGQVTTTTSPPPTTGYKSKFAREDERGNESRTVETRENKASAPAGRRTVREHRVAALGYCLGTGVIDIEGHYQTSRRKGDGEGADGYRPTEKHKYHCRHAAG